MKRLKWVSAEPVDALIFDSLGVEYLKEGIPHGVRYTVLSSRDQFPIMLSPRFLWRWKKVFGETRLGFMRSYIISLIDIHQPKVVLSFSDTNSILGFYQTYRNNVLVISVQNAMRFPYEFIPVLRAPHYFALGKTARKSFDEYRIPYKRCEASGSLPLSIFCSRSSITRCPGKLVFVSNYRIRFDQSHQNNKADEYLNAQARGHSLAFKHALRYAEEFNRELTVIAKGKVRYDGEHFAEEKAYFDRLAGDSVFTLSSTVKDTLSSYHHALTAEFIIGLDSTLLYEAFSVGARVLFCWGADRYLLKKAEILTEHLPEAVLLKGGGYDEFSKKINFLRGLTDEEYNGLIEDARSEYVSSTEYFPVHEKLKHEITAHLGRA